MASMNEASDNVTAAREAAERGDLGAAFRILRYGRQTSVGDDAAYPAQTSPGDEPYYPYFPPTSPGDSYPDLPPQPTFVVPPGWYPDPFDGVGYRWWNGQGWTSASN